MLLTVDHYVTWDGRVLFQVEHAGTSHGPLTIDDATKEVRSILHRADKKAQIDELRAKANELAERANDLEKQLDKSTHGC